MKLGITSVALFWLFLLAAAWAEAADEYSFNWLDPDKKIYVLQNRKFLKANRLMVSAVAGPGESNAYRTTYMVSPRMAYYFSEAFGVETFYTLLSNSENATYESLKTAIGNTAPMPVVREIRSQYGLLGHWVPWYAKINVFNKILYFDWYFQAGAGMVNTALDSRANPNAPAVYTNQNSFGAFWGTGHQYHLNQTFTVRLDFTATTYNAPLMGATGSSTWFTTYLLGLGVGVRL